MNLNEYQKRAATTDLMAKPKVLNAKDPAFVAKILGLVGESGEVADKIKKLIRDQDGAVTEVQKHEILKEIGDVLWYVSAISGYLGTDLEAVAEMNLAKLASRKARGVQRGSGDNR